MMAKMRKLAPVSKPMVAIAILLGGCSYAKTVEDYRNTLTAKLCMDYLTAGRLTHTEPMEQALNERGEDCKEFVGAAERRRAERRRRSDEALRDLQRLSDKLRKEGAPRTIR